MSTKQRPRICNRCGAENPPRARVCGECDSERFAPGWVIAKRPINRQVGVEVTQSDPAYGEVAKRITLSKWWPGGRATFHLSNPAQWEEIQRIINTDLGPKLGWHTKAQLVEAVQKERKARKQTDTHLKVLVKEHPGVLQQIADVLDPGGLAAGDVDDILQVTKGLVAAFHNVEEGFKAAFLRIVEKLPRERRQALEQLEELLGKWSLQQIATVAQQVKGRLDTIDLFKQQIMDDRTYELRGPRSIHRILENAMWLVDERYWLLQSNETLLKFIGDEMIKADRKAFGNKRPDFLCGTVEDKLIIIEIKRPAHELDTTDLNQLETYVALAKSYKNFRSYEAYLVGRRIGDDLKRRQEFRASSFKVWTYADLLDSAEARYRKYLRALS